MKPPLSGVQFPCSIFRFLVSTCPAPLFFLLSVLSLPPAFPLLAAERPPKPNVLFIAVDDLNHWVGHLGRNPQVKTPNIDRLAKRGVSFSRAYCAAPACNPSRAALMSGLRPNITGVYLNGIDYRELSKWLPRINNPARPIRRR